MGWETEPILRNSAGDPVPQHWNEETQAWEIATSVQKTEVTGSIVEIVKEYKQIAYDAVPGSFDTPARNLYFGDELSSGGGNSVPYLDTSEYPHIDILIQNNTDAILDFDVRMHPLSGVEEWRPESYGAGVFRKDLIFNQKLEPGEWQWLRGIERPELNRVPAVMVIAKAILSRGIPETGDLSVVFLGSKV